MTQKIGPREQQLRDLREAKFELARTSSRSNVRALREKVAAIPAKKPKKERTR